MNKRIKVIYVPDKPVSPIWRDAVVQIVGPRHDLATYDSNKPLRPQFERVDVVVDLGGSWGTREMADAATSVKLWQIMGTGFDHFDLNYWKSKKIPVANCPGPGSGAALGECAMMFMLLLSRGWHESQESIRQRIMCKPIGLELEGKRLGLVGFGASARELAHRARAFGMRPSAIDIRDIPSEERGEFGLEFVGKPADLDRLVRESDFLSLHLHLNEETRHIIDERKLRLMKPTAYLINVSRGALVDEEALYKALVEKRIAGAGLDVFSREPVDPNSPLLKLPNVVAAPHIAGVTDGTACRRAMLVAENCDRIAAGLDPLYRVDGVVAVS